VARAVTQRLHVAERTLRRSRAGPDTQDDRLYPPTAPLGLKMAPDRSRALVLLCCLAYTVPLLLAFHPGISDSRALICGSYRKLC